jgi:hypothetical protein
MQKLENIIQDLNQEERMELFGLIKKSFVSEEITRLENQLVTATRLEERVMLKNKIGRLSNE